MVITDKLRTILYGSDTKAIVELISNIENDDDSAEIVVSALHRLDDLHYEDLANITINLCISENPDIAHQVRHSFLSPWIKGAGYYHRPEVLSQLSQKLNNPSSLIQESAIRTIWVIGYRDDLIESELFRIAGITVDDPEPYDPQGYALATLASISPKHSDKIAELLQLKVERQNNMTEADCWATLRVGTPWFINYLNKIASRNSLAVYAMLHILLRFPESSTDVWHTFTQLPDIQKIGHMSTVARIIDLTIVMETILQDVLRSFKDIKTRNVLPLVNNLLMSNLVEHLDYIRKIRSSLTSEELAILKLTAVGTTGNQSIYQTTESLNKKAAWDVVLRLGLTDAREWISDALRGERNFILSELAKIAGFLQVSKAVTPIKEALMDGTINLGIAINCVEALGIIGTLEALDTILSSDIRLKTKDGAFIPAITVEAITAICMAQKTIKPIWELLKDNSVDQELRKACIYVIEDLSTYVDAPLPPINELIDILRTDRDNLPDWPRLTLCFPCYKSENNEDIIALLHDLAKTDNNNSLLNQSLAKFGLLINYPDRLKQLGLTMRDGFYYVADSVDDASAVAILDLYRHAPSFEPAVINIIDSDSLHLSIQIVGNIKTLSEVSNSIKTVLLNHALNWNGPMSSEGTSLSAIAKIAPELLLSDDILDNVSHWCSTARISYLTALREISITDHFIDIARIACQFTSDEDIDVRREASRLARDRDIETLQSEVIRLASNVDSIESAIFMLDAAFWLHSGWEIYREIGQSHREGVVRDHADELVNEYKNAILSRQYLEAIFNSDDYLKTWCFGQAVVEIGNEDILLAIYNNLPDEIFRRSYLLYLTEELEKKLEEKSKKRNEQRILPPPNSQSEPIEFTLHSTNGETYPLNGTLSISYKRRARRWVWSWLIRVDDAPPINAMQLSSRSPDSTFTITISDGRKGEVVIGNINVSLGGDKPSSIELIGNNELINET